MTIGSGGVRYGFLFPVVLNQTVSCVRGSCVPSPSNAFLKSKENSPCVLAPKGMTQDHEDRRSCAGADDRLDCESFELSVILCEPIRRYGSQKRTCSTVLATVQTSPSVGMHMVQILLNGFKIALDWAVEMPF